MEDGNEIDPASPPPIITDTSIDSTSTMPLAQQHDHPLSLSNPSNEQRPIGTFHWNTNEANTLWLAGWIPTMEDQYLSACLGLFLIAIIARGLNAMNIFLTTWLRARDFNQLPIAIRNNKMTTTSNSNSLNNIYSKRSSRASVFLLQQQQQQWNTVRTTAAVRQSPVIQQPTAIMAEPNRQNNNSIIMNDESRNNNTRRSFTTPGGSTLMTTTDSGSSSKRQQQQQQQYLQFQQAQQQKAYNRSTKDFTSIDFSDNNDDNITIDNPPMEESDYDDDDDDDDDDDATSYVSAASTPYSINNKRTIGKKGNTRKLSKKRAMRRYYSTTTSYNNNKHLINTNRKSVEPIQQQRQSILFSSAIPLTTTPKRCIVAVEKAKIPWSPRFGWITDTLSSVLTTFEYFFMFLLTMTVMTGNVQYFISILLGIFIGEMIFGRLRGSIHQFPIHDNYNNNTIPISTINANTIRN